MSNIRNYLIAPLIDQEKEILNWSGSPFNYPDMVRIRTDMDGSCFFHAIAKSFYKPYQAGMINGIPLDRGDFIKNLRKDLALKLGEKTQDGRRQYDLLSKGELANFGKVYPEYKFDNMVKILNDNKVPVDNVYNEFISNVLNKDIYLLDLEKRDVYMTGDDENVLYKNRDSIVILVLPGHYELIGLMTPFGAQTLFKYNHPFIQSIRTRMRQKKTMGLDNQMRNIRSQL